MDGNKNSMIESFREGTESECMWLLRKMFLIKNLNVNDGRENKDHLAKLSKCFANIALGRSYNYPPNVVYEVNSRSFGLEDIIKKVMDDMQNPSNRSEQRTAVAASSSCYNKLPEKVVPHGQEQYDWQNYSSQYTQNHSQETTHPSFNSQEQTSFVKSSFSQAQQSLVKSNDQHQQPYPSLYYGQSQSDSSVYAQNKNDADLYGNGYQHTASAYGQCQRGSVASYDYSQQGNTPLLQQPSSYCQSGAGWFGQSHLNTSSYGANDHNQASTYGLSQQSSMASYSQGKSVPSSAGGTRQSFPSPHSQIRQNLGSHDGNQQSSSTPYDQSRQSSRAHRRNRKRLSSSPHQGQRRSGSYDGKQQSSYGQSQQNSGFYGSIQHSLCSYDENDKGSVSSYGCNQQDSYYHDPYDQNLPRDSRTVYAYQDSLPTYGNNQGERFWKAPTFPRDKKSKEGMKDKNALYATPGKKGHPSKKGFPKKKKCPWRKDKRKRAALVASKSKEAARIKKPETEMTNRENMKRVVTFDNRKFLQSSFKYQPLFEVFRYIPVTSWDSESNENSDFEEALLTTPKYYSVQKDPLNKAEMSAHGQNLSECKDLPESSSTPAASSASSHDNKETLTIAGRTDNSLISNSDIMAISRTSSNNGDQTTSNVNSLLGQKDQNTEHDPPLDRKGDADDSSQDISMKLRPIQDLAEYYSKMDKDSSDPFAILQRCAAGTNQKIKSVSKSSVNSEGCKEIRCQIFANDVSLVSVIIVGGTPPHEAKKKLASAVLEKLAQPHLRLVSDEEGGLTLESSRVPFAESVMNKKTPSKESSCTSGLDVTTVSAAAFTSGTSNSNSTVTGGTVSENKESEDAAQEQTVSSQRPFKRPPRKRKMFDKIKASKVQEFDSFIAWSCEQHPMLKKVRQLGHMYYTLPFKATGYRPENPAVILQLLANVSGIRLEIKENQGPEDSDSCKDKYSVMMEKKVILCSLSKCPENPTQFISSLVLKKISMQYLCLEGNVLHASPSPFKKDCLNPSNINSVTFDSFQEDIYGTIRDRIPKPVRLPGFCLLQSVEQNRHDTIGKSADFCCKKVIVKYCFSPNEMNRYCYITLDDTVAGGTMMKHNRLYLKRNHLKDACNACISVLRKCHWTIHKKQLSDKENEEKFVYPGDMLLYLPNSEQVAGQTKTNRSENPDLVNQLLSKSQTGNATQEPILCSELNSTSSSMGLKKSSNSADITKRMDGSNLSIDILLETYADSTVHKPLYIPCPSSSERMDIFRLAEELDMTASTHRIQGNERVVITKNLDARMIVIDCLELGGKSDIFQLIPPQEEPSVVLQVDFYKELDESEKAKNLSKSMEKRMIKRANAALAMKGSQGKATSTEKKFRTKTTQCNFLEGPRLEKLKPMNKLCEIVYRPGDSDEDEKKAEQFGRDNQVDNEDRKRKLDGTVPNVAWDLKRRKN